MYLLDECDSVCGGYKRGVEGREGVIGNTWLFSFKYLCVRSKGSRGGFFTESL